MSRGKRQVWQGLIGDNYGRNVTISVGIDSILCILLGKLLVAPTHSSVSVHLACFVLCNQHKPKLSVRSGYCYNQT